MLVFGIIVLMFFLSFGIMTLALSIKDIKEIKKLDEEIEMIKKEYKKEQKIKNVQLNIEYWF